jgi:hypothetical protein
MASTAPTQVITTVYMTRNILGPLTTVFTAPQECDVAALISYQTSAYRGQSCTVDFLADASTCWPQVTAAAPLQSPPLNGWGFYSPGISCPAGYTSACSATQGSSTGWVMQFPMDEGETAVGCCPTYAPGPGTSLSFVLGSNAKVEIYSNYSCTSYGNGQTCVLSASTSFLTAHCGAEGSFVSTGYATVPLISTITTISGGYSPVTSAVSIGVKAPMIQINWRSEDLAAASQSVSSPMSSGTRPSPTSSDPTSAATQPVSSPTSSNTNQSTNSNNSISAGALSGAVIGGVVCLFAIAAAVFLFIKRRKTRDNIHDGVIKAAVSDRTQGFQQGVSELSPSERPAELPGLQDSSELSGYQRPIELPVSPYAPQAVRYRA